MDSEEEKARVFRSRMLLFPNILALCSPHCIREWRTFESPIIQLPPFGFEQNGTFYVSAFSENESSISLFIIPYSHPFAKGFSLCPFPKSFISEINYSSLKSTFSWKAVIPRKGVYIPVFLNCHPKKTRLFLEVLIQNGDSLIDYRCRGYSYLRFSSAMFNCAIFIVWMMNKWAHPEFSIGLHWFLRAMPLLKAAESVMNGLLWMIKGREDAPLLLVFSSCVFSIGFNAFSLFCIFLSLSGWCVYREALDPIEMLEVSIASIFFASGFECGSVSSSAEEAIISLSFTICGFLWYIKKSDSYFSILGKLGSGSPTDPVLNSKLCLVKGFIEEVVLSTSGFLVLNSIFIASDFWPILSSFLYEIASICVNLIEFKFFHLGKECRGRENYAIPMRFVKRFTLIEDPIQSELTILTSFSKAL